jgi:hypothetical protein
VQCVKHVAVIFEDRDFQRGFNDLFELVLCLLPVMYEFDALLLVLFPEQVRGLLHKSLADLKLLLKLVYLREEANIVSSIKLTLLEGEELLAGISSESDLFRPLLDVDDVGIFDQLVEFVHLLLLHLLDLKFQTVKKPNELFPDLSSKVEILALNQRQLLGREDLAETEVNILKKTLGRCLQE